MELYQIRYFLRLCETLNFTQAAKQCNVSQPALTRAIKLLEQEFGGELLRRERRHTHLTPLAKQIMPMLEQVYLNAEGAKQRARSIIDLQNAQLELGIMCTIGPHWLLNLFNLLKHEQPGIALDVQEAKPEELIEGLLDGRFEAALISVPGGVPERFSVLPLYQERFVVTFPPAHRFSGMQQVAMADLHDESYLLRTNCEHADVIGQKLREQHVEIRICYRSPREDWIQNMVLSGLGVSMMPEHLVRDDGPPCRPLVDPEVVRRVDLITVGGRSYSNSLESLMSLVVKCFPEHGRA